jgi:putative NIF3 family GTP cyclohydrolase 1 type 2
MKATELYQSLESDFQLDLCWDDWSEIQINHYLTENFIQRYMGLVLDNTEEVTHVFTAVFPTPRVINYINKSGIENAMLFTHHPMNFDLSQNPIYIDIKADEYGLLMQKRISLYTLHTPLDKNGPYSTSMSLAKALNIEFVDDLCLYFGHYVGLIGKTTYESLPELQGEFERAIGHRSVLYQNGTNRIQQGLVGIVSGGGNDASSYEELHSRGINTFITGIGNNRTGYLPSIEAHETAKRLYVNILVGTHYSTEKFACMNMVRYFNQLGVPSEFVEDEPDFNDM